jgi:hypothetical protein
LSATVAALWGMTTRLVWWACQPDSGSSESNIRQLRKYNNWLIILILIVAAYILLTEPTEMRFFEHFLQLLGQQEMKYLLIVATAMALAPSTQTQTVILIVEANLEVSDSRADQCDKSCGQD